MHGTILIIDDDAVQLEMIQAILEHHNYEVITLQDSSAVYDYAVLYQPDFVILDVMMPHKSGYLIAQELRSDPITQHIPIIMLTALDSMKHRVVGFKSGADQYLVKPVHAVELITVIRNLQQRIQPHHEEPARSLAIGVIGVKGGVGTTTVAINLAATLLRQKKSPLLIDFHTLRGAINHYLHLGKSGGICRILEHPAVELTSQTVENEIRVHQSGLRAILSSVSFGDIHRELLTRDKVSALKSAACKVGDPVIVDMSYHHGLDILNQVLDRIIVVLEPHSVALTMAHPLVERLASEGRSRISLVIVNRSQSSLQLSRQDIAGELNLKVAGIISAAPELAFQATQAGIPMVYSQTASTVRQQYAQLARHFISTQSSNKRQDNA